MTGLQCRGYNNGAVATAQMCRDDSGKTHGYISLPYSCLAESARATLVANLPYERVGKYCMEICATETRKTIWTRSPIATHRTRRSGVFPSWFLMMNEKTPVFLLQFSDTHRGPTLFLARYARDSA